MSVDNFFLDESSIDYVGKGGGGITGTLRKDRFLPKVPSKYFHKNATGVDSRSVATRYMNPIVAVSKVKGNAEKGEEDYERVHVSFQSTGPCNIVSVRGISSCNMTVRTKERGRGNMKQKWAIEMNEARALYLATYGKLDRVDHLIKNCKMNYRSWKY